MWDSEDVAYEVCSRIDQSTVVNLLQTNKLWNRNMKHVARMKKLNGIRCPNKSWRLLKNRFNTDLSTWLAFVRQTLPYLKQTRKTRARSLVVARICTGSREVNKYDKSAYLLILADLEVICGREAMILMRDGYLSFST